MDPRTWTFDVDRYLNPFVPCPPWRRLPYPVARFLGHRKPDFKPWPLENIVTIFWAFIGAFCGISVIGVVVLHIPEFQHRSVPLLISSFVSRPSFLTDRIAREHHEKGGEDASEKIEKKKRLQKTKTNIIFYREQPQSWSSTR